MQRYSVQIVLAMVFLLVISMTAGIRFASAQDVVSDFSSGQPSGQYAFVSWTPKSLADLIKGNASGDTVNITGHLFLPPGTGKVPAVVLMHGSGGIYSAMLDFWPKRFNAEGIAVVAIDSFGPRGVQSTASDQSKVPFAADVADAFAALKIMATHPRINPQRIAIMGFSRGGATTWRSGIERIIASQNLPQGVRFAAHVPMYSGGCVGSLRIAVKPGVFTKAPMLWVHGDADDYCPAEACQDYSTLISKEGTPVEFVLIKGAHHKFDYDETKHYDLRTAQRTMKDCPLETDIDTLKIFDRFTGKQLSGNDFEDTLKKSCLATGASTEGNHQAREQAAQAVSAFFKKTLLN